MGPPQLLTPVSPEGHAVDLRPPLVRSPPSHPPEKCITCDPSDHPRQWTHPPGSPPRHRTIVLCFDGTGDSFDKDVRYIEPTILVTAEIEGTFLTEFERRSVGRDAQKERPHAAARLLSGNPSRQRSRLRSSRVPVRRESALTRATSSRSRFLTAPPNYSISCLPPKLQPILHVLPVFLGWPRLR